MKHVIILAAATFALSACASREEKLCRADFSKSLLNPETAAFSGFEPVSDQEIKDSELLSGMKHILEPQVPSKGATYYKMKVRAEGELGNKITKWQFCAIDAGKHSCACVPTG